MTWHVADIWEPERVMTDPRTNAKVDPATVTYTVTSPAGVTTSPASATRREEGVYTARVSLTEPGQWKTVFYTTGTYQGAAPETITVQPD